MDFYLMVISSFLFFGGVLFSERLVLYLSKIEFTWGNCSKPWTEKSQMPLSKLKLQWIEVANASMSYGWWKNNPAPVVMVNIPLYIYMVLYIPGGAWFPPSTVSFEIFKPDNTIGKSLTWCKQRQETPQRPTFKRWGETWFNASRDL